MSELRKERVKERVRRKGQEGQETVEVRASHCDPLSTVHCCNNHKNGLGYKIDYVHLALTLKVGGEKRRRSLLASSRLRGSLGEVTRSHWR